MNTNIVLHQKEILDMEGNIIEWESFDTLYREKKDQRNNLIHSEARGFGNGWSAAINKVLKKIQDLPLSPEQKKYLWKEVKKLK